MLLSKLFTELDMTDSSLWAGIIIANPFLASCFLNFFGFKGANKINMTWKERNKNKKRKTSPIKIVSTIKAISINLQSKKDPFYYSSKGQLLLLNLDINS